MFHICVDKCVFHICVVRECVFHICVEGECVFHICFVGECVFHIPKPQVECVFGFVLRECVSHSQTSGSRLSVWQAACVR